jgi:hypothetical protein
MGESMQEANSSALEARSRQLFNDSVDGLDMRVRSRLTQARNAALDAAAASRSRPWFLQPRLWTPAVGLSAAVLLGAALWLGSPVGNHSSSVADQPGLEDFDIVAASDEASGDAMEMLQNDLDFYDFADKATNSGPDA